MEGLPIADAAEPRWTPFPSAIRLWLDPLPRRGYENMAADELLSRRPEAWLRLYRWARPAVSYGYFDRASVAASLFSGEGLEYIRRWTGGGIVDHRRGFTYTLTLPGGEGVLYPPSAMLYRWIHAALAKALQACGVGCRLLAQDAPDGGRACWASPVESDLVDAAGHKLAGAGQRRHAGAVLHQGLLQGCEPQGDWPLLLARHLAPRVEISEAPEPYEGFAEELAALCRSKYEAPDWEDESRGRR